MKIEYLKLVNYVGVYNGMETNTIEIDFSNAKNVISLLSGKNGSGKSTVLSTLHPFANTMDGRSNFILEGMDGLKEIHISHEDCLYKIEHHYLQGAKSMKTKSFFSKKRKGETKFTQLNPNGTVKSFKELVDKELDVDESFFKLARIGSDTAGFIDMPPAKRKEYLSTFLSEVDKYLQAYKTINTKYSNVNKNIKFVVDQINKLEDEDRLNDRKTNLSNQIETSERERKNIQSKIDKNLGEIEVLDPSKDLYNQYQVNLNKYNEKRRNLVVINSKIEDANTEYPDIDNFSNELSRVKSEKLVLEQKLKKEESDLEKERTEFVELKNEVHDLKVQMDEFSIEKSVSEYKELIVHYKENLAELKEFVSENKEKFSKYKKLDITDIRLVQSRIGKVVTQIDNIVSKYKLDRVNEIKDFNLNGVSIEMSQMKEAIRLAENQLINLRKDESNYSSNLTLVKVLDKRPSNCEINDCPFISKALEHSNDGVKLNEVRKDIEQLVNAIKKHNERLSSLKDKIALHDQLETIYTSNIEDCVDIFVQLPYSEHFDGFTNFLNNLTKDKSMIDFSDIIDFKSVEIDIEELENKIITITAEMNSAEKMEGVMKTLEDNYKKTELKLTSAELQVLSTENEIKELNNDLNEIADEIELFEGIVKDEQKAAELKQEIIDIKEFLKSIKEKVQRIKDLTEDNTAYEQEVQVYESQIVSLNKELDTVKFNIEKLAEYQERKKQLDDRFFTLSSLRTALSTTKGIPLLFIDVYLKKTKKIANELLDIIFNGNFYIEEFKLTESDFFISVRKPDGELVEDVTGASQGEKALISIALSFALIQQSLKKYNILCLDEMDATLDASNRRSFIDMIERQLHVMGVEQCFIISHNEAFDPYPVNLLLFPNSTVNKDNKDFMENKEIIADFM